MRRAHTVAQVRAAEAEAMAGLASGVLMQRAAVGLAHAVADLLGTTYGAPVLLLVGSGDNGGDALWAGAHLARRGVKVEAMLLGSQAHDEGLAALTSAGGFATRDVSDLHPQPDVVLDGIVGIGGRGGLRPDAAAALEAFAAVPVVAVDVPSGVEVDTGAVTGDHVRAVLTVTFCTHKPCLLLDPASEAAGAVHLVDIGLDLPPAPIESLQDEDVAALVPRPGPFDHKYTRGVVGVRAGSATYPGAALLAIAGASCGLAGMVRFVGDAAVAEGVRRAHPEVVGDGRVQAWVVGPGGGDDAGRMLAEALADEVPVVVDADALAHVSGQVPHGILTPHAGELARMLGVDRAEVEAEPLRWGRRAAADLDTVVLLKGHHTLVVRPDGLVRVTTTGSPWLATAGAGDVLAGVIGALLATGLDPFDAASVGSWLHGAAATLAASGGRPITAGAVARRVGDVVAGLPFGRIGA